MPKHAVIFDMDGVLTDSEPIHSAAYRSLFKKLGIELTDERHHSFVGYSNRVMWTELHEEFRLAPSVDELLAMGNRNICEWFERLDRLPIIPGVEDLLRQLTDRRFRLGIASSSPRKLIQLIIQKLGFGSYFPVAISGEDVARGKPAPDIFLATAKQLGVPPAECLVIEDSPHGIAGARAAGMPSVGFLNPNSGNQDLSRADLLIRDFSKESIDHILNLLV
jgi:HAD superfamily hydrolase (TIGR01509 family)